MRYATAPILAALEAHDGLSLADLARMLHVEPSPSLELALLQLTDARPYGVRAEEIGGRWHAVHGRTVEARHAAR